MKRGSYIRRGKRPAWRSAKQIVAAERLREAKLVVLERCQGFCEANFSEYCGEAGAHAHHVLPRSAGGTHDPDGLLWVCSACHHEIHSRPAEAKAAGLLRSRYEAPS